DYIASTTGDQINLEVVGTNLNISTESSTANLKTLPAEDFPLIPQIATVSQMTLPASELRQALTEVAFAAAAAETQPELSGIYTYVKENKLYFVTTDRYRLVERSLSLPSSVLEGDFKAIIVPLKTISEVIRITSSLPEDATVTMAQGENQILFKTTDIELVSRIIDGQFPDYQHLVPKEFTGQAIISKTDLAGALKSVSLFTSTGRTVRLNFNTEAKVIEVSAASGDIGESKATVNGDITGQSYEGTFNFRFLLEYLSNISDDRVVFKVINENSPAVLNPSERDNNFYLVMPVRS
ncbi:MAG TPA: DNA polymerase III subunit beta, partial [Flavobacterium sp.]|nr:DNA polymerase III subunit beta [Flavobacterium sp.]